MKPPYGRITRETVWHALSAVVIAVLALRLYWPYLENPLVFDDINLFHTDILTTAAIAPWEIGIRGLPYFTLGWVETQFGSMAVHRSVSLILHVLVGYQLLRFLEEVLTVSEGPSLIENQTGIIRVRGIALLVAAAFVCHPVAVYGAGYLVQRTIVFATLFALLCLRKLLSALEQGEVGQALWAAAWASLSILSKQHAVLLPVAALALLAVVGRLSGTSVRICAVFLALCAPAMALAVIGNLTVVGQAYESLREIQTELHGLPQFSNGYDRWLLSASIQARLYFSYWQQWLWPDQSRMSADLRVDFLRPWTHLGAWLWIGALLIIPPIVAVVAVRMRVAKLLAFSLVFTVTLYAVELATVRFQEPFALYRSYLWSIGYCAFVASMALCLPSRLGLGVAALSVPILLFQATGRLDTFRSKLDLWNDAAIKLPKLEIAGSSRILFNRGGELFRAGRTGEAMADIDQAILLNPASGTLRVARAVALLKQGRPHEAMADLDVAKSSMPQNGHLLFVQSIALRALGRVAEADAVLIEAARLGHYSAKFELARRNSPTGDVTVEFGQRP